ncbi:hypothetical protein B9Z65_9224 [Elsinoe australis]|uniref:Uncharacterized protein n=1 Tax=Elsinoe australis TaxID=40998 RepID=A0A2P7Z0U9_9PEZI|nr:hypothetical protein B9Z65_9224 [Elsinoe australis]
MAPTKTSSQRPAKRFAPQQPLLPTRSSKRIRARRDRAAQATPSTPRKLTIRLKHTAPRLSSTPTTSQIPRRPRIWLKHTTPRPVSSLPPVPAKSGIKLRLRFPPKRPVKREPIAPQDTMDTSCPPVRPSVMVKSEPSSPANGLAMMLAIPLLPKGPSPGALRPSPWFHGPFSFGTLQYLLGEKVDKGDEDVDEATDAACRRLERFNLG